jgi:hypothetical protein
MGQDRTDTQPASPVITRQLIIGMSMSINPPAAPKTRAPNRRSRLRQILRRLAVTACVLGGMALAGAARPPKAISIAQAAVQTGQ